jgi:REP element-mobilizing transposase RayT
MDGAWYFVTFRLWEGRLSDQEITLVRQHIADGAKSFYELSAVCVMPDHVHLILSPCQGFSLSRIMHGIKGVTAHRMNSLRGSQGRIWQVESWDRIIRDENELDEKLNYMLQNPVKAGLVEDPWSWCGWYLNPGERWDTG